MLYPPASTVAICVVLPVLAIIAVLLRFYVRIRVQPTYVGIDDWLAVAACLFACADSANLIANVYRGLSGRDYDVITPSRFDFNMKNTWAELIIQKPSFGLIKLSVLFFFHRLFSPNRTFRHANYLMIALTTLWTLAFLLAEIFICGARPATLWDPKPGTPKCAQFLDLYLVYAITDVVGDVLIIGMPYPMIRRLHVGRREKWGLAVMFALGTLETVTAIIRLGWTADAFSTKWGTGAKGRDAAKGPLIWSPIEAAIGVIAACLPTLSPLLRRVSSPRRWCVECGVRPKPRPRKRRSMGDLGLLKDESPASRGSPGVTPEGTPEMRGGRVGEVAC